MNFSKFLLISGPCVLQDEATALQVGAELKKITAKLGWEYVFKASYDKANRTSVNTGRGPGLEAGLQMLSRIREKLGVPILTDVHTPQDVLRVAEVVDILQIPAFLCRQTDLLLAAAASGKPVNVKKGQFLAPEGADAIAEKLKKAGCARYWITERGSSFGYNNLVVDMRSLVWMREKGHPVIFDATHSVQRPASLGHATGGDAHLAPALARAAVAVGVDGLFIEAHPEPKLSPSDADTMIPLAQMSDLLTQLDAIRKVASKA